MKYVAPESGLKSYTCPHCGVLARQYHFYSIDKLEGRYQDTDRNPVRTSKCEHCEEICLWYYSQMVYPNRGNAPGESKGSRGGESKVPGVFIYPLKNINLIFVPSWW